MPMSDLLHLPSVMFFAEVIRPTRVVDIGIGTGTYGFMLRQRLDIGYQRLRREDWETVIDGVEVFEAYRNPTWDYAYDNVWCKDVRDFVKQMSSYDLVLCNDVLEHLDLKEAADLAFELLKKCKAMIVTTPNVEIPQGQWGGNEAETHRCLITRKDLPAVVSEKKVGITTVFVCSLDASARNTISASAAHCPVCRPNRLALVAAKVGRGIRRMQRACS